MFCPNCALHLWVSQIHSGVCKIRRKEEEEDSSLKSFPAVVFFTPRGLQEALEKESCSHSDKADFRTDILTFFQVVQTHRSLASLALIGTASYPRSSHQKGLYWGPSSGPTTATTLISPSQPRTMGLVTTAAVTAGLVPCKPEHSPGSLITLSGVPVSFPLAARTGGRGLQGSRHLILALPLKTKMCQVVPGH